ncbi:MAG TPA: hypothetical protein VEL11_14315 [Candidatus Bathyarchaeia archaeon]|nr:hypothetical protein [Candidatus Bathyarchaeia archaeon]
MSEYPYEGRIHSEDKVNYKTVFSSDGIKIGKVEAAFADSFIVKSEKEKMEIKYEIPRLEIASIRDNRITLKLNASETDEKYQTSSIEKSSK